MVIFYIILLRYINWGCHTKLGNVTDTKEKKKIYNQFWLKKIREKCICEIKSENYNKINFREIFRVRTGHLEICGTLITVGFHIL
jgi:hypothetical protein